VSLSANDLGVLLLPYDGTRKETKKNKNQSKTKREKGKYKGFSKTVTINSHAMLRYHNFTTEWFTFVQVLPF